MVALCICCSHLSMLDWSNKWVMVWPSSLQKYEKCFSKSFLEHIAGKRWTISPPFPSKKWYLTLYNWPTVGERVLFLLGKYCSSLFLDLFWLGSGKGRFWLAIDWKTFSFSIVIWCNLHVLSSFLECFSNCFVTYFVTSHISAVLNPSIMKLVYLLLATLTNYSRSPKTVFCCSTFCQQGLF